MELAVESEIIEKKSILMADGLIQQSQTQQQQQTTSVNNLTAAATSAALAAPAGSSILDNESSTSTLINSLASGVSGNNSNNNFNKKNNFINDINSCIVSESEEAVSCKVEKVSGEEEEAELTKESLASNLDIEVLPLIYDIIRCVEKDSIDNTIKQRESHECSVKILELQKRFEVARERVRELPGIDYNPQEQIYRLELLKQQLIMKQQLIRKYKNMKF